MNESTKTETRTRRAASHRSLLCPFSLFRFFLALYPSFFLFFFTYKRSDTTLLHHLALKTLNAVTSQTLTSTFIRQDFKVSPQEPPSTMSQTALSKPPNLALHQRDSPLTEAASLNFLSLFRSTLMATQTEKGKKKSFPRLNSFLLFVKAFVHHLLLPYN